MTIAPHETLDETEHFKQVLRELVDMGTDIARIIHHQTRRQAEAATAALPPPATANTQFPDPAIAFDRISRTIRRTILLSQKLAEPPRPSAIPTTYRIAARKRVLREVEDMIELNAAPADRPTLNAELLDRLDAPDLEDDIGARPLDDIIIDICHDLRVAHPYADNWKRRSPQQVETLRQRAAALPPARSGPAHTNLTNTPRTKLPDLNKRHPRKPTLSAIGTDPIGIIAEFARISRDTG